LEESSKLPSRSDLVVSHDLVGLLRRSPWFSPWLLTTVQGDEGLADLLHSAANRRVRCVSFASSGGVSPRSLTIAGVVPCCSLEWRLPRIEVHTPRRIPLTRSRGASPRSLPPRTLRAPSILDRPVSSVSSADVVVVSKGRGPSRLCSVSESVPASTLFRCSLAYPPWALFPSEVAFLPSFRKDRVSGMPCILDSPRWHTAAVVSLRAVPDFLRARSPSRLGNPTSSSSVCSIRRMLPRSSVAMPSRSSVFPSMDARYRGGSPGGVFADAPSTRPPRVVFFRTPSVADTARCRPEDASIFARCHRSGRLAVSAG